MRSPLVLLALVTLAAPALADKVCSVSGTSVTLYDVTVAPRGEDPFQLGLHDVPITATLPKRCGDAVTLHVTGSLELTAKREHVWMHVTRDVTTSDGMVTLKRGSSVVDACISGENVRAAASIHAGDVHGGEMKQPSVLVRDVEIPCDALTLDAPADDSDPSPTPGPHPLSYWRLRGEAERVKLRAEPKPKARGHLVESPGCVGCIHLRHLSARRGWVFVEVENEGVSARGWARTDELRKVPASTGVGYSSMCTGSHGGGTWGESRAKGSVEREGTVRADARVYREHGTGEWGRFAAATRVKVEITKGSLWAKLRRVPGLGGHPMGSPWLHGHVLLDTVTLDPVAP